MEWNFSFCKDPLWHNASTPTLIPLNWCFQHVLLALLPIVVYFITLSILYIQTKLSIFSSLREDWLTRMKSGLTVLIISDKIFVLIGYIWKRYGMGEVIPPIEYILPIFQIITFLSILSASKRCLKFGIGSSGQIFCTWLMFVACGLPKFYTSITANFLDIYEHIENAVFYVLICLQLILHLFTLTHKSEYDAFFPEYQSSFLSRQFFWWFNKIVGTNKSRPLVTSDLFDLDPELESKFLAEEWRRVWSPVVAEYRKKKHHANLNSAYKELYSVNLDPSDIFPQVHPGTKLLKQETHHECVQRKEKNEPAHPSIIRPLFSIFKWQFIGATVAKALSDILQNVNPLLLGALITFIEKENESVWKGILLAISMFITAEVRSLLLNVYFSAMYRVGVKVQSILTIAVYEQTLKLSTSARKNTGSGEINNLMAIDVARFQQIAPQIQQYWSSPFSILLGLSILYIMLGWSAFGGVIVCVLLIPCNTLVVMMNKKWQIRQMAFKDKRLKLTSEVLNGIKVVKLYGWEQAMMNEINELRKNEINLIRKEKLTQSIVDCANASSPFIVAAVTFALFTLTGGILTPQVAFVSIAIFIQLRASFFMIADLIGETVQIIVSNNRLKSFLVVDEIDEDAILRDHDLNSKNAVDIKMASFNWDNKSIHPTLKTLNMEIPRGQLVCVIGEVGSGKSSFLSALLNEMDKFHGFVGIHGRISYVPQQPWIQNLTFRDNILFGKPWDEELYHRVINACALEKDIRYLPDGDMTQIGEKGVNLSGGQKARCALARALYNKSDILLLDDVLSAVDAIVGKTIFDKAIGPNSLSKHTTRILVTHSQIPLEHSDLIVIMQGGEIFRSGKYVDLIENGEVSRLICKLENTSESLNSNERERTKSIQSYKKSSKLEKKLIAEEKVQTGSVGSAIYLYYLKKMGRLVFSGFISFLALNYVLSVIRSFWLSTWSDNVSNDTMSVNSRLGVFVGIGLFEVLLQYISNVFLIYVIVNTGLRLHQPLLHNIIRSKMSFFDVTPLGRLINRFSKDIEVVDSRLIGSFRFFFICIFSVFSTLIIISISTPLFILVVIPLFIAYVLLIRSYIPTSRQLERLSSITRSPLFSSFSEIVEGVSSIRAYNVANSFYKQFCSHLDLHIKCKYNGLVASRWLSMRLEIFGNVVILSAAIFGVMAKEYGLITAGIIGLSVSYSLNVTNMLNYLLTSLSNVETNIVSVERIAEFSNVNQESSWNELADANLPKEWPINGSILIRDLYVKYRPDLDYSLIGINAAINPGEKIGICGRTGAGKSSLAQALFRLIEPQKGQIFIDDINIATLGLHTIRERLTIIPQDPVVFSGSIIFNLDPFSRYSDSELFEALKEANLGGLIESLPTGLNYQLGEGGQNISVGQRQLLCLARAILRKSKIIIIDEGTANVDVNTDQLIQRTIREKFANSTVLTIAHRINTIIDYDRIMVLEHGHLVEFDTPDNLLKNKDSLFYSLCEYH